ncbi:MAG: dNTP triphosphohydrolase [Acidobacteriota bacterium]|nr:dNTP triphosphohydrolase [Acidobacteriota bacterium]
MLSSLRFPLTSSRGRRYPEPEHPYRNAFQRDRQRVVHARAFRRLEAKTQVFAPGMSDHFRNRLTHTIEVAQIARTVANVLQVDEDLTEALALVHDIGHPPFAHAGEAELDRQMSRFGERFDHNIQALRIVEAFEQRYARFPGLNLTFEVREGIVKHSRDFARGENAELDEYLPGLRPPLEAQLIDLADEIAYDSADLDDGYSARLFKAEDVAAHVPAYADILETIETQYPGASERDQFQEVLRLLTDWLVSGLIEGTVLAASEANVRDAEEVRQFPGRVARFTPAVAGTSRDLKGFMQKYVFSSPELKGDREQSGAHMGELFQFFLGHPGSLPEPYRERAAGPKGPRVICDYLAGMTDVFFNRTYNQLLGT